MQLTEMKGFIFTPLGGLTQRRSQANHATVQTHLRHWNVTRWQLKSMAFLQTLLRFGTDTASRLHRNFIRRLRVGDNGALTQAA
jgi:hypothetical protein